MEFSPQQDDALTSVADWLKDPDQQCFRLFGYAGTGKTTLAKHFAEGVDGRVLFAAFTGKAAHVLRKKGCSNATTIHSLIYNTKDKSRALLRELEAALAELRHELRQEHRGESDETADLLIDMNPAVDEIRRKIKIERDAQAQPFFTLNQDSLVKYAKLLVIDECSMVDASMGADLLSFGTKVLVLGDPAQLPPIRGAGYFTENVEPDFMLTDIHRQATDNPIIAMATKVRQQEHLEVGDYGDSKVLAFGTKIEEEEVLASDQILVGRNKTRHGANRKLRRLLGRSLEGALPVAGDRLVCLRNNHDLGLLNGAIWMAKDVTAIDEDRCQLIVVPEDGGDPLEVEAHSAHFRGDGEEIPWFERTGAEEFAYGYALTVHKAQGSQWDDVLLFDESSCFREDKWRWLYTGCTRAAERITIAKMS